MTHYYLNVITKLTYFLVAAFFLLSSPARAQDPTKECINCFSTELLALEADEACTTIQMQISASNCNYALSHLTIEVPCGTVSSASNSMGWPMEINSKDPTTGIWGLKIDDINDFGEDGDSSSFTIEYTICYSDAECKNIIEEGFDIAYKASTCVFTDQVEPEQSDLEAYLTPEDILCYGSNSGQIITTITEGKEPFSFQWNNGSTSKDLIDVAAGTYEVTITDANDKSLTLTAIINQPEDITTQANVQNTNCGQSDGYIEVSVTGGTEPYTYKWNNGATNSSITNLEEGQYTLTITDANDCAKTFSYNIYSTTSLRATITTSTLQCHEEGEGSLTVTPNGGIDPYTYLWDNGDTTATANNLNSGMHTVVITDAAGCSIEKTSYVIISKLNATAVINNPACNGEANGSATITVINGTEPYDIVWNTGSTETTITDLGAGWYWADITDANGCTYRKYVNITEPSEINLSASFTRTSCNENDSNIVINLHASGGTAPYSFYYEENEIDDSITITTTGDYEFTVIDSKGCEKTETIIVNRPETGLNTSIRITQPNCISDYGTAVITVENGVAPYTASWSDGSDAMTRNDLTDGNYQVIITDAVGCTSQHSVSITSVEIANAEIITPDVMPDCSSSNHNLFAFTNNATSFEWTITNSESGWNIDNEQVDQITYTAGDGTAWVKLSVTSSSNCMASDSILLSCIANDVDLPEDSITDGDKNCDPCYTITPTNVEKIDDNCYQYSLTVHTDGTCSYELSHMTFEIEGGYVKSIYNSKAWKVEANSTDPTTGLYGFKIDDISNFGKSSDQFNVEFTVCYDDEPQNTFAIAYKSAQCVSNDHVTFDLSAFINNINSSSYPNPFTDATQIKFTSAQTGNAELNIYDIYGNFIDCIYNGPVDENTYYNFEFRPTNTNEGIYFYRLICGDEIVQGKLMKIR
nr:T9SS type A sorting domain-containing protein [uncultured Carboxylicivirga sp.]